MAFGIKRRRRASLLGGAWRSLIRKLTLLESPTSSVTATIRTTGGTASFSVFFFQLLFVFLRRFGRAGSELGHHEEQATGLGEEKEAPKESAKSKPQSPARSETASQGTTTRSGRAASKADQKLFAEALYGAKEEKRQRKKITKE